MKAAHLKNNAGFTLVEFMIASVMIVVFLLAVSLVMIVGYRNWHINHAVITLNDDLVKSVRGMVRELREAGATSPGGIQILGPESNGIRFELPATVGPLGPTAWQTITYNLTGTELLRTDGTNVRVLATDVFDVDFTYNALTNPREIGMNITGSREATNGTLLTQALSMEVTVRN